MVTVCKVKGCPSAMCWNSKTGVYLLTSMNNPSPPPASGHFLEKEGNALKPL